MKSSIFLFVAAEMALALAAAQVCKKSNLEREENSDGLDRMWTGDRTLDCSDESIDAATTLGDGLTYFFKDDFYWRMADSDVDLGYPRLIEQDWDGLNGPLDAALTWKDGRTFFFKGHQYWSFHGLDMDPEYPRNISEGFCGIPGNLNAALLWKNNNQAYFFKGENYWRFEGGNSCNPVTGPLPMSGWKDIPSNVDAALQWKNGRTYFLKGKYYYRYDDDGNDTGAGRATEIQGNWGLKCSDLQCRIP